MSKRAYGYTWRIRGETQWQLCKWAAPSRERLMREGKPSPEAQMVRVELVPTSKTERAIVHRPYPGDDEQ